MINEKHIYELDYLIPRIFETKKAEQVIERIIDHIEILEAHIERISDTHKKLYSGKLSAEKFLASEIILAKKFLEDRNAKRSQ